MARTSLSADAGASGNPVWVARAIGQAVVALPTVTGGFYADGSERLLLYESTDCTGTAYATAAPNFLLPQAFVDGTTAYYPTALVTTHAIQSIVRLGRDPCGGTCPCGGTFTPPNRCCIAQVINAADAAPMTALDLSTLGLVPPFHVEGP